MRTRLLSVVLFSFALAGASLAPAVADDDLRVVPSGAGVVPANTRLYAYLQGRAKVKFDERRKTVAALKTAEDVAKRQTFLKAKFLEGLGELPTERTPLNAKVVGRDRRDGYSVERVIYESRPNHHVTALFYLPDGPPPFPGVLFPCGHSENGKAAEAYQRACILLAKNGLAVLCYDPIGQGERTQLLKADGKPAIPGSTSEHTMVGLGAYLVGRSVAGYRVWDGLRSLDYLASRSEIDPKRLGCTGNSGGGTLTSYLMALDDRIYAAVPSCYITSLERLFATIGPQDGEQNITGQVDFGLEHADFITLRAPKPTLISCGTQDFFDIDGSWTTFREVKEIYGKLGYGERVDLFESDEPHGFTRPRRTSAMRFLRRWLLDKNDAPIEPEFSIATDKEVQCTETGQVLSALKGVSAFDLNAEKARQLAAQRAGKPTPDQIRTAARERLALPAGGDILVQNHKLVKRDGYTIDLWTLDTEPSVTVVERLFRPENATPGKPIVVYVGADRALGMPGGEIEKRVKGGEIVAMIEPRGTGETTPGGAKTSRKGPFGPDETEAFLALQLNRPLLSQRVFDVIQSFRAMEGKDDPRGFHLIGVGPMAVVALHAAAIDDRVKELTLDHPLLSWTSVVSAPVSRDQLGNVIPGVLASYDLPELAAALAPRPLTLKNTVDPAGKAVAAGEVEQVYSRCKAAYASQNAADRFQIQSNP